METLNEEMTRVLSAYAGLHEEKNGAMKWWDTLSMKRKQQVFDLLGMRSNVKPLKFSDLSANVRVEVSTYYAKHKGKIENIGQNIG